MALTQTYGGGGYKKKPTTTIPNYTSADRAMMNSATINKRRTEAKRAVATSAALADQSMLNKAVAPRKQSSADTAMLAAADRAKQEAAQRNQELQYGQSPELKSHHRYGEIQSRINQGNMTPTEQRAAGNTEIVPYKPGKPPSSGGTWVDAQGNLTKKGLVYGARYTGEAIQAAISSGNVDLMPNVMSPHMANELGIPIEVYAQWYDENGVRRQTLGLGGSQTQTYGDGTGGGSGARRYSRQPGTGQTGTSIRGWRYGVIQWRI